MLPPVATEVTAARQPIRSTASLSMSTSGTLPQPTAEHLGLDPAQVAGLGLRRDLQPPQVRHLLVQRRQLGAHLFAQLIDEHRRVQVLAQLAVVLLASLGEIRRQVLVRVTPRIGADHPDLLATQLVP